MTHQEAYEWLRSMVVLLGDEEQPQLAWEVNDAASAVQSGLPPEGRRWLADYFMPGGRRGRVRRVLYPPYDVRVYGLVATILRLIDDESSG